MADKTRGQAAYEAYASSRLVHVFGDYFGWDELSPGVRAVWETAAAAAVEACGGSDG